MRSIVECQCSVMNNRKTPFRLSSDHLRWIVKHENSVARFVGSHMLILHASIISSEELDKIILRFTS